MQKVNLHTHSTYSDGKSTPREIVEEAVRQEFTALGFSEHGPLPFETKFAVKAENMPNYVSEIAALKEEFKDRIKLNCALETDYITGVTDPFASTREKYHLDYVIGGVHLVGQSANPEELWFIDGPSWEVYDEGLQKFFDGDIRKGVKRFFEQTNEMIEHEEFNIIAHFDKIKMHNRDRYFHEDEEWYRKLALETLDLIKEKKLVMEVNTRGIYKKRYNGFYPSPWLMKEAYKRGIPAIISSDAHHYSELSLEFEAAEEALKEAGYHQLINEKTPPVLARWGKTI